MKRLPRLEVGCRYDGDSLPTIDFGSVQTNEILRLFIGKKIGEGEFRRVYEYGLDPSYVLKVEWGETIRCNSTEWMIWQNLKRTSLAKWLAPCVSCSWASAVLMQVKCKPIEAKDLPTKIPRLFADLKAENWGIYDGRPVCFDYGNHNIFENALKYSTPTRRVKWK